MEQIEHNDGFRDKTLARLQKEARGWVKQWKSHYGHPDGEVERLQQWDPLVEILILSLEARTTNPLFYFNCNKELAKYLYSDLRSPDINLNTGNVMVAIKQFSNPVEKVVSIEAEAVKPVTATVPPRVVKPPTKVSISKSFKVSDDIPPPRD